MSTFSIRHLSRNLVVRTAIVPIMLAVAVSACSTKKSSVGAHSSSTGAARGDFTDSQIQAAVKKWGAKYSDKPNDRVNGVSLIFRITRTDTAGVEPLPEGVPARCW